MNLYSLIEAHKFVLDQLLECTNEDGEVLDSNKLLELSSIEENTQVKQQDIAAYILNLESDIEQMGTYIDRMAERLDAARARAKRLKELLKMSMVALSQTEIECDEFTVKLKNTPGKVVINAEDLIPDEFMRTTTIKEPDKIKIADELKKEDGHVPGCHFERGQRVEIK